MRSLTAASLPSAGLSLTAGRHGKTASLLKSHTLPPARIRSRNTPGLDVGSTGPSPALSAKLTLSAARSSSGTRISVWTRSSESVDTQQNRLTHSGCASIISGTKFHLYRKKIYRNKNKKFLLRYPRPENNCGLEQAQTAIAFLAYHKFSFFHPESIHACV